MMPSISCGFKPASLIAASEASSISLSSVLPEPRLNADSPTPTMHALSFSEYIVYSLLAHETSPRAPVERLLADIQGYPFPDHANVVSGALDHQLEHPLVEFALG